MNPNESPKSTYIRLRDRRQKLEILRRGLDLSDDINSVQNESLEYVDKKSELLTSAAHDMLGVYSQ